VGHNDANDGYDYALAEGLPATRVGTAVRRVGAAGSGGHQHEERPEADHRDRAMQGSELVQVPIKISETLDEIETLVDGAGRR
jgi:hypothetical protein